MPEYRVELDVYSGPLDLLLYLIRRNEVDINDIPVAPITEQYMEHLKTLKVLDINVAGEFLVMAATLMEVKSAMMMPREATDEDMPDLSAAEDPTDPRYELIHQLLAYKRFKDAASELDDRREQFESRFARKPGRSPSDEADDNAPPELDVDDVSLWDLVEAFNRIMEQTGGGALTHDVVDDDTPIELHMTDIVDRLQREGDMTLQAMFGGRTRGEMIGLFLATLELIRQYRLKIQQREADDELHLCLRPEANAGDPANNEPDPGDESGGKAEQPTPPDPADVDAFDWPDEMQKKRYARRQERRAQGEKVEEDEQLAEDIRELEAEEDRESDEVTE